VVKLFAEAFHLGEGVLVAGAVRGGDAFVEAGEGFVGAVELGQRLGRHLICGDVIGIVGDKGGELFEPFICVALANVFHGESVAGEGVGGVELKDFVECGDLVHTGMVRRQSLKGKRGDLHWSV